MIRKIFILTCTLLASLLLTQSVYSQVDPNLVNLSRFERAESNRIDKNLNTAILLDSILDEKCDSFAGLFIDDNFNTVIGNFRFNNVFSTGAISQGGDSGGPIVCWFDRHYTRGLFGITFASNNASSLGIRAAVINSFFHIEVI